MAPGIARDSAASPADRMPAPPTAGPERRTFRRSLSARTVSVVALLMFGLALATRTTAGDFGVAWYVLAALTLASVAGVVSAWGDRITIDPRGIETRNVLLARVSAGRSPFAGRRVAWADVLRVQEHRRPGSAGTDPPRALFLVPVKGRRLALDSLEDFDEVVRLVRAGLAPGRPGAPAGINTPRPG